EDGIRDDLVTGVQTCALPILYLVARFTRDDPVMYRDIEEHFKYGSTGGERESGIPYWIWKVMPKLFPEYLPGKTYVAGAEYSPLDRKSTRLNSSHQIISYAVF